MASGFVAGGAEGVVGLPGTVLMAETVSAAQPKATGPRVMPVQDLGWGFSRVEAEQVWGGVLIMTVAFALAYIGGVSNIVLYFYMGGFPLFLMILAGSFVAVATAFFGHEIAHKALAQRYAAVAEFRHSPVGLLFGLISASIGIMIAVPGAVVITGQVTARQQWRISAAGPIVNLVFAGVFFAVSIGLGTAPGRFRDPLAIIIGNIAFVNVLLAMFNLIPVRAIAINRTVRGKIPVNVSLPASDGWLILTASRPAWAVCVAVLAILGIGGRFLNIF